MATNASTPGAGRLRHAIGANTRDMPVATNGKIAYVLEPVMTVGTLLSRGAGP